MSDISCPFCGEGETVYIGTLKEENRRVYQCKECDRYFSIEELDPPFDVTIEKVKEELGS